MKTTLVPWLFCFALLISISFSAAQDIRGFVLERDEFFTQCTTNRPVEESAREHGLIAAALGVYSGALVSGTVTSRGMTVTLTNSGNDLQALQILPMPAGGRYHFDVTTASGQRAQNVVLAPFGKRVAPARIANYQAAQDIDASQPFTLQWDPTSAHGDHDSLTLRILDSNGVALVSVSLAKTETSYTVPAGTLHPNETHAAYLHVVHYLTRIPPTLTRPFILTLDSRRTRFTMKTRNPAGTLRFPQNQIVARETDATLSVPVERIGGSEGTVNVDYYFEDLTAHGGTNYVATPGTLVFTPGVVNQSIIVPLLNDSVETSPLVARVWLTNATGGVSGPRTKSLDWTILDGSAVPGPDVNAMIVSKVFFYSQTNAAAPGQKSRCEISRFFTSVHPKFPGAISNAVVQIPDGTTRHLDEPVRTFLDHSESFPSHLALDRAFRPGKDQVTTDTRSDGTVTAELKLGREPVFPVPHLSNWTEAQSIDPSAPFTLRWEPFTGATSNDFVLASVQGSDDLYVARTPDAFEPGALPGTTTEIEIPANAMKSGQRYRVNIVFVKSTQCLTASNPSTIACVTFAHTTVVDVKTTPDAANDAKKQTAEPLCCGTNGSDTKGEVLPTFEENENR